MGVGAWSPGMPHAVAATSSEPEVLSDLAHSFQEEGGIMISTPQSTNWPPTYHMTWWCCRSTLQWTGPTGTFPQEVVRRSTWQTSYFEVWWLPHHWQVRHVKPIRRRDTGCRRTLARKKQRNGRGRWEAMKSLGAYQASSSKKSNSWSKARCLPCRWYGPWWPYGQKEEVCC